jgi:uncharacterized protein (DUF2141 family)
MADRLFKKWFFCCALRAMLVSWLCSATVALGAPKALPLPSGAVLQVKVTELVTHQGYVKVMVADSKAAFLHEDKAIVKAMVRADLLMQQGIAFYLPEGSYTVAVVHDLDSDGKFDHNAVGVPTEPFGFSRNPKIFFGPPSYKDCVFEHGAEGTRVTVKLKTF